MKKNIIILFILIFNVGMSRAQHSAIQIKDIIPVIINTLDSTKTKIDTAHQTIRFYFKISNLSQMDSVYFLIGTKPNKADIGKINAKCVHLGSSYFIRLSPTQLFLAGDYEVYAEIPLELPYLQGIKYVSTVVKDKSGQLTNQLTIKYYF